MPDISILRIERHLVHGFRGFPSIMAGKVYSGRTQYMVGDCHSVGITMHQDVERGRWLVVAVTSKGLLLVTCFLQVGF